MHPTHAEYFVELKQRLDTTPQGERGKLVEQAGTFLCCSPATVYRKLKHMGWDSGRETRSDCGSLCMDEGLALQIGGIIRATTRANDKRTLPITTAVNILGENGKGVVNAETGEVTMPHPATVARAMKAYGCHPDQVAQSVGTQQVRSLHPNHVWQMDASVCTLFYLPQGKIAEMDERKYNAKKPHHLVQLEKDRARVIRWVITDHYSGWVFVRYTLGAEDAATAISVLIEAMCLRGEGDIMHGAPFILYTDKGSAYVSGLMVLFLKQLGIRGMQHEAGKAWRTGQVEQGQNLVETQFEGRLKLIAVDSLEQLGAHAAEWQRMWNSTAIHSRHGRTRDKMWMTITREQLRVPQSALALRAIVGSPPVKVTVNAKFILNYTPKGYKALTYSLRHIDGLNVKDEVGVSVNPYEAPAVDVIVTSRDGTERTYTLQPIEKCRAGFDITAPVFGESFKALPETATDKAVKAMDKDAYGLNTLEEVKKARARKTPVYQDINVMADVQAARKPTYLPKIGQPLAFDCTKELAKLNPIEAAGRLRPLLLAKGIVWTSEHLDYLKTTYGEGADIPVEAIEDIVAHFIPQEAPAETPASAPALRLAVGG